MSAYHVLKASGVLHTLSYMDQNGLKIQRKKMENGHDHFELVGKSSEAATAIFGGVLELLCDPGMIGDMFTASSPLDITFWVLHPALDRLWQLMRMSSPTYSETWLMQENECIGHGPNDIQPFSLEIFNNPHSLASEMGKSTTELLTNTDLYQLLHPRGPALSYVYDDYRWRHCERLGFDMTYQPFRNASGGHNASQQSPSMSTAHSGSELGDNATAAEENSTTTQVH